MSSISYEIRIKFLNSSTIQTQQNSFISSEWGPAISKFKANKNAKKKKQKKKKTKTNKT
jgi:hypothetical protein